MYQTNEIYSFDFSLKINVRSELSVEGAKLLAKTRAERLVQNVLFPTMFRDQTDHQYVLINAKNVINILILSYAF